MFLMIKPLAACYVYKRSTLKAVNNIHDLCELSSFPTMGCAQVMSPIPWSSHRWADGWPPEHRG